MPGGAARSGPVNVAIRPEHVRLAASPAEGTVSGRVENVVYFGTDTLYHLRLATGEPFTVRMQNARDGSPGARAGGTLQINGREVNPFLGWVMTVPFNILSRCPVLTVPSGHASNGVPTDLQIVGRTYCDEDMFRAGLAYETALDGWYRLASTRLAL